MVLRLVGYVNLNIQETEHGGTVHFKYNYTIPVPVVVVLDDSAGGEAVVGSGGG